MAPSCPTAQLEYDADMDPHDQSWTGRDMPMGADTTQLFLFKLIDNGAPFGPTPDDKMPDPA
jgi:hypothetical protein